MHPPATGDSNQFEPRHLGCHGKLEFSDTWLISWQGTFFERARCIFTHGALENPVSPQV
jgi:hypothetical protein